MPKGIYNRKKSPINKKNIPKEELEYFYNREHLTTEEIGNKLSCSGVTVGNYLKGYSIKFVPYKKKCKYCREDFLINSPEERKGNFCSKKCCDRDYYLRIRAPIEVKGQSEKNCLCCNKLFLTSKQSPNQKYCSSYCSHKHQKISNPIHFKEYSIKHYKENMDKIKKRSKEWREENRELYKKNNKEYYSKNKDKIIKNSKKWYEVYKEEENKRRRKLGLPLVGEGFMCEMELLVYVHNLFQDYEILTHHRKELGGWGLQGLELDIYLPELKLAFEYMGKQHYNKETFDSFCFKNRTKEDFEYQLYRDRCKKKLCKMKGITLIKIKYDEKLSEQLVLSKMKYLPIKINQMRFGE
ncbi:MAG: hypothetical protein WC758_07525 [Candidatus Woesearchaeota archaeon]|jgi:hypothetical protein